MLTRQVWVKASPIWLSVQGRTGLRARNDNATALARCQAIPTRRKALRQLPIVLGRDPQAHQVALEVIILALQKEERSSEA